MKEECKAKVTISTIKGYANGAYKAGYNFDQFTAILQEIEEKNFSATSVSWLAYQGKTIYKREWGAPTGGEEVFILEADYTEYDRKCISVQDWKNRILEHAEFLREWFGQSTVRVTFIESVETIILR